jgi:hypothetical protein
MFKRYALLLVAGAALILDAATVAAQTKKKKTTTRRRTTTSSQRIPISKEQPAAPPRVDTVTVYRTDTLRMEGRVDTLRLTGPTVTVHDTVIQQVQMQPRHIGGMYFGLGAGPALPFGSIRTVNQPGAMGQINWGWQPLNSIFGLRLDGAFTQYAHAADYAILGDKPKVWNINGDVRLDLPIFNHTLGSMVLFRPYLIGGGSWLYYNNLRVKLDSDNGTLATQGGFGPQHAMIAGSTGGTFTGANFTPFEDDSYHSSWGWNLGGGLSFHSGKKELFVEARWMHFTPKNNTTISDPYGTAWHVPITFGVNFF